MNKAKAFTLMEILIVVVLLGVLAAIVIPTVANSTTSAKDSALAADLQLLRRVILVYKTQHLEVGPGYPDGDTTQAPTEQAFIDQATMASNTNGQTAAIGTPGFNRGPYLMKIPVNPFNLTKKILLRCSRMGRHFRPTLTTAMAGYIRRLPPRYGPTTQGLT